MLAIVLTLTFSPYIFDGKTFLPSDLFDTMTSPSNAEYKPPQAQNHYIFDGLAQAYPYKILTQQALRDGNLAYWNPHILAGYPQYAESLANNFDIFNLLLLWFNPLDTILLQTILELFVAGIGMVLLLRFFGVNRLVNIAFAGAYMLNTMFITSAHYRCTIASFCWMPFVVLMLLRFYHYGNKENLLFASMFLALSFLGGNFQTSFFAAAIVSVVLIGYPSKQQEHSLFARCGFVILVGLLSFVLSAVMWLPSLELLFQTLFHGGSLNSTNVYDEYTIRQRILSLPLLITFVFPGITGNAQSFNLKKIAGVDIMNFSGAIGYLPMLFAIWGSYRLWKSKHLRPFILLILGSILLPIATPLFAILYHRFFIVASFAMCIIGAVTFHSFVDNSTTRREFRSYFRWTNIFFASMTVLLLIACGYLALMHDSVYPRIVKYVAGMIPGSAFGTGNESWMYGRIEKTLQYYSLTSLGLWIPIVAAVVLAVLLSSYSNGRTSKRTLRMLIVPFSLIGLVVFTFDWLPALDQKKFPIYPDNKIVQYLREDTLHGRYATWRDGSKDPYLMPENNSVVYGLNDIHGYETLSVRSMSIFFRKMVHTDTLDLRLLGLANVRYVLTGKREVTSSNLRKLYSADSMTIYENLRALPRAYFAFKSKVVPSDKEASAELLRPDFDGSTALFTSENPPDNLESVSSGQAKLAFGRSENELVSINAVTDSKCILILTDTYYPGWKCYVNGLQRNCYRVNQFMRGVVLEPGKSEVVFRFEPDIFKAGAGLTAVGILFTIGGIVFSRRKKGSVL
ncbi:MAG: YfhO family protein [Bacteroidota bacterium]|nr:YfhO family protein [Bacteroidota bacterium]